LSDWITYSFFESPAEFRVELQNPSKQDAPKVTALLEFTGLGWRVTRVKLPIQDLSKAIDDAKAKAIDDAKAQLPQGLSSSSPEQQPTATAAPSASEAAAASKVEELRTKWSSQNEVSPLDKSPKVILTKLSQTASASEVTSAAILALRCMERQTSVVVKVPEMIISINEKVRVDYRIGDNQPVSTVWDLGGGYKILFAPSGSQSVDLIKKMEAANDFYIRVTPERGDTVAFSFDLDGLKGVLAPLKVACEWGEQTTSTPAPSAPSKKTITARVPKQQ
jgi:type VI secretion system VasI family protein